MSARKSTDDKTQRRYETDYESDHLCSGYQSKDTYGYVMAMMIINRQLQQMCMSIMIPQKHCNITPMLCKSGMSIEWHQYKRFYRYQRYNS